MVSIDQAETIDFTETAAILGLADLPRQQLASTPLLVPGNFR
jgi:hypothetical protein